MKTLSIETQRELVEALKAATSVLEFQRELARNVGEVTALTTVIYVNNKALAKARSEMNDQQESLNSGSHEHHNVPAGVDFLNREYDPHVFACMGGPTLEPPDYYEANASFVIHWPETGKIK